MHADYKKLSVLKQQFPDTPLLALTATATEQVARDLCEILRMQGCERFAASIDRPCLIYEVRRKPSTPDAAASAIIEWVQEHAPERTSCGIVYCLTRKARWWRVMARSLADSKQVVCTGRAARVCVCVCGGHVCLSQEVVLPPEAVLPPRAPSSHATMQQDCEATAVALQAAGITALPYHADMDPGARSAAQASWTSGEVQVHAHTRR
jgi:superfamily II DNA helicase RecQ